MELLENSIQEYAWGSRTAIAELLGTPSPSPRPQAELWMGAHPAAPSRLRRGPASRSLIDFISEDPRGALGAAVAARFDGKLPFLLKVLAAEEPLSLQAHPSLDQARAGFAREEAAGIPRNAPHRNYKDPNHKPELLCALTPFDALCGFRLAAQTRSLFDGLQTAALSPVVAALTASPGSEGVRRAFEWLMSLSGPIRADVVAQGVAACRAQAARSGPFRREYGWAVALAEKYPGDVGALSALLLNLLTLLPGEAIYLPAGNLHAYLRGVGVEIMASSDNVLRGGLTPKHVDLQELLRVLDFCDGPVGLASLSRPSNTERAYVTPAPDFRLSAIELSAGQTARVDRRGAEILLCARGAVRMRSERGALELARGAAVFASASDGPYTLEGDGQLFRATVGDGVMQ